MSKLKSSDGNVQDTHDENPSGGGSLDIIRSLLGGSLQKTPGTEVAYDIDSTSYSVVKYSWDHKEKIYGEDAFIHHSVWPNNEDYVSLVNKPRDMIGLGALDDSIISSDFPDDK